jgi:hypothetical protein
MHAGTVNQNLGRSIWICSSDFLDFPIEKKFWKVNRLNTLFFRTDSTLPSLAQIDKFEWQIQTQSLKFECIVSSKLYMKNPVQKRLMRIFTRISAVGCGNRSKYLAKFLYKDRSSNQRSPSTIDGKIFLIRKNEFSFNECEIGADARFVLLCQFNASTSDCPNCEY